MAMHRTFNAGYVGSSPITPTILKKGEKYMSNNDKFAEAIFKSIRHIVAIKLNRVDITWEEVEKIYASGEYPDINKEIHYILYGDGTGRKICAKRQ